MKKVICISPFILIGFCILLNACDQKVESRQEESIEEVALNPNGDSELALLMRGMYDEADRIRHQIENNEKVTVELNHLNILTAHTTEAGKANSAEFKAFASIYLKRLEELKTAEDSEKVGHYQSLIESCMSCHQAICPGPIVRIKKLRIRT